MGDTGNGAGRGLHYQQLQEILSVTTRNTFPAGSLCGAAGSGAPVLRFHSPHVENVGRLGVTTAFRL